MINIIFRKLNLKITIQALFKILLLKMILVRGKLPCQRVGLMRTPANIAHSRCLSSQAGTMSFLTWPQACWHDHGGQASVGKCETLSPV